MKSRILLKKKLSRSKIGSRVVLCVKRLVKGFDSVKRSVKVFNVLTEGGKLFFRRFGELQQMGGIGALPGEGGGMCELCFGFGLQTRANELLNSLVGVDVELGEQRRIFKAFNIQFRRRDVKEVQSGRYPTGATVRKFVTECGVGHKRNGPARRQRWRGLHSQGRPRGRSRSRNESE